MNYIWSFINTYLGKSRLFIVIVSSCTNYQENSVIHFNTVVKSTYRFQSIDIICYILPLCHLSAIIIILLMGIAFDNMSVCSLNE